METDIILISDTEETENRDSDQQCNKVEVSFELLTSLDKSSINIQHRKNLNA